MQYDNDYASAKNALATQAGIGGAVMERKLDITMRENIDEQIKGAEARVAQLQEIKSRLEKSNLLDMRIDDLKQAMRW